MTSTRTGSTRRPPTAPFPLLTGTLTLGSGSRAARRHLRERYGDAYHVKVVGLGDLVVVSDKDLARQVYRADPTVLHAANAIGPVLGGHSLFSFDEDKHRTQRKMLTPPFTGAALRRHHEIMLDEARREIATWPVGERFASLPSMNAITMRVILRAVYGMNHGGPAFSALAEDLPRFVQVGQALALSTFLQRDFGRFSPGGSLTRFRRKHAAVVDELAEQARHDLDAGRERSDVLSILVAARDADGLPLSRDELVDNLLALVIAGYETTAGTLAWTLERITRHPDLLRRLQVEARSGDSDDLRAATLAEVQRTRPIVQQTLRRAMAPFPLGDYLIDEGQTIVVDARSIHDDAANHERPGDFDPDRYVGSRVDPSTWIPFGGGLRRCIGASFAQAEMDIVLREVLRGVDLAPTTARREPTRFRGVTYSPGRGGEIEVIRHSSPDGG
ncbi:cytochrome P450 [Gordonia malaquae]|uniref:cytochrome P450 n=1 Tax=Gordonia malaquae TaxID=410332 RepID=UPI003019B54D